MMSQEEVLTADSDRGKWLEVIESLPPVFRDLYFGPDWVSLHSRDTGTGLAFVYREGDDVWLYPSVRRKINKIGGHDFAGAKLCDLESAYGYAGPISSKVDEDFCARARQAFDGWCREERIVAEFIRFHPLFDNERYLGKAHGTTVIDDRRTVAIDLSSEEDYTKDAAYMIRRGFRAGLEVSEVPVEEFPRFVGMYQATMKMVGADDYYYFNDDYYAMLAELTRKRGRLLVVSEDDEWVSVGVFLDGEEDSHYHLSASTTDRRVPGATNLLLDHAAQLAREQGKRRLHLGGGRTPAENDSLLKFKAAMGRLDYRFKIGKQVHLPDEYALLIEAWEEAGGISEGNPVLLRYRQEVAHNSKE